MRFLFLIFIFLACSSPKSVSRNLSSDYTAEKIFISHPSDKNKKIEFFIDSHVKKQKLKTIVFIHGHQFPKRLGGYDVVKWGVLDKWKKRGFNAVSISQPGYGESDGPADYCGMFTQDAVIAVLDYLDKNSISDREDITLIGVSRGAMVSGMVASRKIIKNLVLIAGAYDLGALYHNLSYSPIKRNIAKEAGTESWQFRERSVLSHAEKINSRVLILHGKRDRAPTYQNAKDLFSLLKVSGNEVELNGFDSGHRIPIGERKKLIDKFIIGN